MSKTKSIAVLGTLDTKGDQVDYLKGVIQDKGHETLVIDVGVLSEPTCEATITRHQVAQAAGMSLAEIIEMGNKGQEARSMAKMTEGVREILKDLNGRERMAGVLSVGGSMGTALALNVMDVLPLTMPKVVLSTIANSPAINPDYYTHNIIMMPWIGGLWGINDMARGNLDQAAGIISSASEAYQRAPQGGKKIIGAASMGQSSTRYLFNLRPKLEKKDYDVVVFHGTGMSPRLLEKAIEEGSIDIALELVIGNELTMEVIGSAYAPTSLRLEAAIKRGIPLIASWGTWELCCWDAYKPIPDKFSDRPLFEHNALLRVIHCSVEERLEAARILTEKLNRTTGPTALVIPLKSTFGATKYGLGDPEGIKAVAQELKRNLKPEVRFIEVNASDDEPLFSEKIIGLLEEMIE